MQTCKPVACIVIVIATVGVFFSFLFLRVWPRAADKSLNAILCASLLVTLLRLCDLPPLPPQTHALSFSLSALSVFGKCLEASRICSVGLLHWHQPSTHDFSATRSQLVPSSSRSRGPSGSVLGCGSSSSFRAQPPPPPGGKQGIILRQATGAGGGTKDKERPVHSQIFHSMRAITPLESKSEHHPNTKTGGGGGRREVG